MRYLRRQVLNKKTVTGRDSVYVDQSGEVIIDSRFNLLLPRGSNEDQSPDDSTGASFINGMIRYNTDEEEFEGYQDGAWRKFRFKEPGNIVLQNLGTGDAVETTFGPLIPDPYVLTAQSDVTWDALQMAKNLTVLVENVYQIGTVNFTIVQNPSTGPNAPYAPGTYIVFGTAPPSSKPVYVFHNFDQ